MWYITKSLHTIHILCVGKVKFTHIFLGEFTGIGAFIRLKKTNRMQSLGNHNSTTINQITCFLGYTKKYSGFMADVVLIDLLHKKPQCIIL